MENNSFNTLASIKCYFGIHESQKKKKKKVLTTPLADFVLTSSFTNPNPDETFGPIISELVYSIN